MLSGILTPSHERIASARSMSPAAPAIRATDPMRPRLFIRFAAVINASACAMTSRLARMASQLTVPSFSSASATNHIPPAPRANAAPTATTAIGGTALNATRTRANAPRTAVIPKRPFPICSHERAATRRNAVPIRTNVPARASNIALLTRMSLLEPLNWSNMYITPTSAPRTVPKARTLFSMLPQDILLTIFKAIAMTTSAPERINMEAAPAISFLLLDDKSSSFCTAKTSERSPIARIIKPSAIFQKGIAESGSRASTNRSNANAKGINAKATKATSLLRPLKPFVAFTRTQSAKPTLIIPLTMIGNGIKLMIVSMATNPPRAITRTRRAVATLRTSPLIFDRSHNGIIIADRAIVILLSPFQIVSHGMRLYKNIAPANRRRPVARAAKARPALRTESESTAFRALLMTIRLTTTEPSPFAISSQLSMENILIATAIRINANAIPARPAASPRNFFVSTSLVMAIKEFSPTRRTAMPPETAARLDIIRTGSIVLNIRRAVARASIPILITNSFLAGVSLANEVIVSWRDVKTAFTSSTIPERLLFASMNDLMSIPIPPAARIFRMLSKPIPPRNFWICVKVSRMKFQRVSTYGRIVS